MIEFLKSFLFGIVEGITEWLPISSTGHLILLNQFVKLDVSEEFYSMFEVVIQLGAILALSSYSGTRSSRLVHRKEVTRSDAARQSMHIEKRNPETEF